MFAGTEGVWHPTPEKKKRHPRLGTRRVTAEVLTPLNSKRFVISVIDEQILNNKFGGKLQPYPKGVPVYKNRRTVVRGLPERLAWTDETARARTVTRHLAARQGKPANPIKWPSARLTASSCYRRKP